MFFLCLDLVLVVAEASTDLNFWNHFLSELRFGVHYPASGVSQASVNSYTFVDRSCEGIPEKSLSLIYIFLFFFFMGGLVMFE